MSLNDSSGSVRPNEQKIKQKLSRRQFIHGSSATLLAAGAVAPLLNASSVQADPCSVNSDSSPAPTDQGILKRYHRAQVLQRGAYNKEIACNTTIYPHWIDDENFWYVRDVQKSDEGDSGFEQQYRLVNVKAASNQLAFDHRLLAQALAETAQQSVVADALPVTNLNIQLNPVKVEFTAFERRWIYDTSNQSCQGLDQYPDNWKISPDGKMALFMRDYNLWLRDLNTGNEKPLTQDGERFYVYASTPTTYGRQEYITLEAIWSPDSRRVFTQIIDTRKVKPGPPLIQHVPTDGSMRPRELDHPRFLDGQRRVGFPGDEHIESYRFVAIEVESGKVIHADYPLSPVAYPPYAGYFTGRRGWWGSDSRYAWFLDQPVGARELNLVKFDTHSGRTAVLIKETSEIMISPIPISHLHTLLLPLPESNELIWFSERSGWAHLYLYEMSSGRLKKTITRGRWLVRNVLHFDPQRRELFIQTAGRVSGRNPYYCDICRVNIDSGELTTIVSSDHEYVVCDQSSRISMGDSNALGVSPGGACVVTTRSRVDQVPVTLVFDRNGRKVMEVETADVSGLPDDAQWPEPVLLKAADGKTDIYGVVFRPSDFDPQKSYPVLDCSYSYASPVGSFTNNCGGRGHYMRAWAYAELGFIAVVIFNRGTEGLRDVAFNAYRDPMLEPDPSLMDKLNKEDCVAGITQLAERHPYMDLERVGIVEFGSIAMAVAGLLLYPDFYKVGVSANGIMDWRLMGAFHMSAGEYQLPDFAANLRGKLLIIAGMLDDVVPAAMIFRLVEALKNANKRFDMLMLPNLAHGSSNYTIQRSWDYVVEHLLCVDPPTDFRLVTDLNKFSADLGDHT